jgi:hypothetical protein
MTAQTITVNFKSQALPFTTAVLMLANFTFSTDKSRTVLVIVMVIQPCSEGTTDGASVPADVVFDGCGFTVTGILHISLIQFY